MSHCAGRLGGFRCFDPGVGLALFAEKIRMDFAKVHLQRMVALEEEVAQTLGEERSRYEGLGFAWADL